MHEPVGFLPARCSRFVNFFVSRIGKADRGTALISEIGNIIRRVFDVDIRSDLLLFFHEAQTAIWDPVVVQPLDCLLYSGLVEITDE